jgi:hypothetical protein
MQERNTEDFLDTLRKRGIREVDRKLVHYCLATLAKPGSTAAYDADIREFGRSIPSRGRDVSFF